MSRTALHTICTIKGCDNKHVALGMCRNHYASFRYDHGDSATVREHAERGSTIMDRVRVHTKVVNDENGEHWIWTGATRNGAKKIPATEFYKYQTGNVRVAMWIHLHDERPDSKHYTVAALDTCPDLCVNPDHLHVVNYHRKVSKND